MSLEDYGTEDLIAELSARFSAVGEPFIVLGETDLTGPAPENGLPRGTYYNMQSGCPMRRFAMLSVAASEAMQELVDLYGTQEDFIEEDEEGDV